jgi:VanZ family protein
MSIKSKHWSRFWLPPLLWMVVISLFSTDHFSGQQTSRFIGPLLRFFLPDVADATISSIQLFIRKTGHFTEYAILFLFWYRAFHRHEEKPLKKWNPKNGAYCLGICIAYAVLDEWHQTWTSHRIGSPIDVILDSIGGAAAMLWIRWRNAIRKGE